ncbi:MAG: hypothetical protein ACT6Q8_24310 [Niveispirillum sp.]|uniref:hypothetical protein n=1 Tax=Niveispirillum sp. TaxID=1917217 RepID=UPI004036A395
MVTYIVIAGLSVDGFDALTAESKERIAPSGKLFAFPVKLPGYSKNHALKYQEQMRDKILELPETTMVSITIAYVNYGDQTTTAFVDAFRPFALVRPINPFVNGVAGTQISKAARREYGKYLADEAQELRARAKVISEFTHIRNTTPYLLPYKNFKSRHHYEMITRLYNQLGTHDNVTELMKAEANQFSQHHPRIPPPGQRDTCFSDGRLYFRSPGRNRHGYFRHEAGGDHHPSCLLAARSRLGGSYSHDLHYDCLPVNQLADSYPNCHDTPTASKKSHVNICPNDYII